MDSELRVETPRLELVPFSGELIDALGDRVAAANLIGAALPDGWPDTELSQLLTIYAPWVAEDPPRLGYGPWVVIARDERSVVGSAGFTGTLKEDASLELGFGIHPGFRNRGYAAESVRALVDWALGRPSVEKVVARCKPGNLPSVRVLQKIGMTRLGEQEGMLLWEARRKGVRS
jgi:ribosomal-protein-alanine N-acetyltransferase